MNLFRGQISVKTRNILEVQNTFRGLKTLNYLEVRKGLKHLSRPGVCLKIRNSFRDQEAAKKPSSVKLSQPCCRKIKGLYENRLRANQQKAYRMEQALLNQTFQVSK